MSDILDQCDGNLLTITLNRAEDGNGLNDAAIAQLTALLQGASARARLVLLKAEGGDFCVGRLAPRGAAMPKLEALQVRRGRDVVFNCYAAFRESPVPIIAAVQGRALSAELAVAACVRARVEVLIANPRLPVLLAAIRAAADLNAGHS